MPALVRTQNKDSLLLRGIELYNAGNYAEAVAVFETRLKTAEQEKDLHTQTVLCNNLGNACSQKGDAVKALGYYQRSVKLSEALGNDTAKAKAIKNIGTLYESQKDFDAALRHYQEAETLAEKIKDSLILADCANNRAMILEQQQLYEAALKAYQQALGIYERKQLDDRVALTLNNMGVLYKTQGDYTKALEYYGRSAKLSEKIGDQFFVAANYINMGNVHRLQKQHKDAVALHEKSLALGEKNSMATIITEAYANLAEDYAVAGDFSKAYSLHKRYKAVQDSFLNVERSRQLAEMQTRFETEKKEQQITLLNRQNTIQQLTIGKRNTTIGIIAVAFLAAIALGLLFYNRYKLKQEARLQAAVMEQQDIAAKAVIEAEEQERRRIAGDLHDGLGQLFSAVKMNLSEFAHRVEEIAKPEDKSLLEKTIAITDESCREIRSISHQMMPNILLKSGLVSAVRDFIDKIQSSRLNIRVDTFGLQERLDPHIETVLYRVIQESVNNVIKHSGADTLDIQMHKEEAEISITIEDNGKGFEAKDVEQFAGIGLKNMMNRIAVLKGHIEFDSAPGKGTVVSVSLPLNERT
ncbi:MAG: tetratricopeptide repeat-containing sensor histidine kinase [Chitinophagaceae bacterium]